MNLDYLSAACYYKMIAENPDINEALNASLSPNQIVSKIWMVEELYNTYTKHMAPFDSPKWCINNAEIIGSWFGWPLVDLFEKHEGIDIGHYSMWDIDQRARVVCRNYSKLFKMTERIKVISEDYWEDLRDGSASKLIINTSSEHMASTFKDLNQIRNPYFYRNPVFVVQSNNMRHIPEHINCCDSEEELIDIHGFTEVFYSGTRDINDLSSDRYQRFMVIGTI